MCVRVCVCVRFCVLVCLCTSDSQGCDAHTHTWRDALAHLHTHTHKYTHTHVAPGRTNFLVAQTLPSGSPGAAASGIRQWGAGAAGCPCFRVHGLSSNCLCRRSRVLGTWRCLFLCLSVSVSVYVCLVSVTLTHDMVSLGVCVPAQGCRPGWRQGRQVLMPKRFLLSRGQQEPGRTRHGIR